MNTINTTINIRVDKKTKREADKTLKEMGLDLSSGIKLFLKEIIRSGSIPFQVRTVNGFTPEYEEMIIREYEDALKNSKPYTSAREMHEAILAEDDDE
ncbi:MAG: type II toxin-antitoxin system RelB/DinJ family antitoxin [bacterium]|nr:type II toxin-antitoxin system RelB/DinJ family antitoxin [bacterium]